MSLQGDEIKVIMQLYFKASKNESEYEVLLADQWATKYIGVIKIIVYSDSQLVARQLKGTYEIKSNQLCKYT